MSAKPVASPCINVCQMRPATALQPSQCAGCFRSIDEIVAWGQMSDAAKLRVWQQLPSRGLPKQRWVDADVPV